MPKRIFKSGKIDSKGMLHVSRIANLKQTCCPYGEAININGTIRYAFCGDWCPHFSELDKLASKKTQLELCSGTIMLFEEFSDERT